jgi:hypothetical protein
VPKELDQDFIQIEKVFRALNRMTKEEFVEVVGRFFNDYHYANGCWGQFISNPLGYIYSRSPMEQGELLYQWALEKAKDEDYNSRNIQSAMKKCYRRFRD